MTKIEFLNNLAALYDVMNRADHEAAESWTTPCMSGFRGCSHIDGLYRSLVAEGVITQEQLDTWYSSHEWIV